jgi:ATP-binding cassette subfamily B protein
MVISNQNRGESFDPSFDSSGDLSGNLSGSKQNLRESGYQNSPEQNLAEQLVKALGQVLSASEIAHCSQRLSVTEPPAGQRLWYASEAPSGIQVILKGKVRLLDRDENLALTLEPGAAFGEFTLFPEERFQSYSVRAAQGLQIATLGLDILQPLMRKYPVIWDHLHHQAILRDLYLVARQSDLFQSVPRPQLLLVLSLLRRHLLKVGDLPADLKTQQTLWLVRRGELHHGAGQRLTAGTIYPIPTQLDLHHWSIAQPTELFSLSPSDLETILVYLPELRDRLSNSPPNPTPSSSLSRSTTRPQSGSRHSTSGSSQRLNQRSTQRSTQRLTHSRPQKISRAYFPSPGLRLGHWWQQTTHRYPFFEQQSATDCGVACLVMIGRYWGKQFGINQLRGVANVDRSGASLRGLIAAAESVGFSTRPIKATLAALAGQKLPAIAHWEGKHYVVVYEVRRDRVLIADPAIGQRSLTHTEFQAGWTGYTLLVQPTAFLKDAPEAKQDFWRFFEIVKPHRLILLEVLAASLLTQVFGLFTPLFTQLLIDRVVVQRSITTFFAVGLGLMIFSLFSIIMTSLRRYLLYHTANRIDLSLAIGFITHAFRLPLNYFDTRYVGDITSRVQENRTIRRFLSGDALTTLLDMVTVVVYAALMFWYSWQMSLLAFVIVPILTIITVIATPFLQRISREIFNAKTVEGSYLIEALSGISTIKSMGIERTVRWHWEDLFNKSIKTNFSGQIMREQLRLASSLLEVSVTRAVFLFGVWQVIHDELTIGQLVAFNMLLGTVISPFQRLIALWNDFQEVLIAMERINDVIDTEPEEDLQTLVLPSLRVRGHIRFDKVTFRYNLESETNTLENLSFEILPGQTVAIVGRSGSGKTTISKLVLGLYPATEGRVLIDGQDVNNISKRSLRQQVGVVDQDTFLFGGSIRENLAVAHPNASLAQIQEAARQAGADAFIQELPMQYDTQIGEGGGLLSGGQRQRLAIARALLGNPRLLILDEATSSLDAESERIIQNNLSTIIAHRTTLVIAHRLSTVRNADLILVLDHGILVESGTHKELMAKRGQYFYLNQQQLAIAS